MKGKRIAGANDACIQENRLFQIADFFFSEKRYNSRIFSIVFSEYPAFFSNFLISERFSINNPVLVQVTFVVVKIGAPRNGKKKNRFDSDLEKNAKVVPF